jgi:hypothetical protein
MIRQPPKVAIRHGDELECRQMAAAEQNSIRNMTPPSAGHRPEKLSGDLVGNSNRHRLSQQVASPREQRDLAS